MPVEPLLAGDRARLSAALGESHFREFKSGLHGSPEKKQKRNVTDVCRDISTTLVAFANADGGELLVGIEDSGEVTGLQLYSYEELEIFLAAHKTHVHKDTPLPSVNSARAEINGKSVLYFSLPKSQHLIHLTSDGKCLQRKDLESVPVAPKQIVIDRKQARSREYDREFIDGASLANLETKLIQAVANQISPGMSPEKCLQYLGLADYESSIGLRLRRAAVLLFSTRTDLYHPTVQIRLLRVNGTTLGTGSNYNVTSDKIVRTNILNMLGESWEQLRLHLVQTKLGHSAMFEMTYMYPEHACREALVNAIAHRDYSEEGRGIEIYIFNDRIEIKSPGGLVSPISVEDLKSMKGVHQSRNSYIGRALREVGYMRELGEGMRRIFDLMKSNELAPPEIENDGETFSLSLFHRPIYSPEEVLWLQQYDAFSLSAEQKAIALLGRKGGLIAPQDIWDRLGLVDTEHYRRLVSSLQVPGILESTKTKQALQNIAKKQKVSVRSIPRFRILLAKDIVRKKVRTSPRKEVGQLATAAPKAHPADNKTIFVSNLPPVVNNRDMVAAFERYGEIANVHIPSNGAVSRGYGFVEFESAASAQKLLKELPVVRMGTYALVLRSAIPRIKH